MKQNLTFIVLRSTPVNDRTTILNAYSREFGRVSFLIPAGRSREATRYRAILQPLSVAEGLGDIRHGSDLIRLSQCRPMVPMNAVYVNPVKNAVAVFISEMLSAVLHEQVQDESLFDYITLAIRHLGLMNVREAANFHICFMLHFSRLAGIEPDWESYSPGYVFDLDEGRFRAYAQLDHRMLDVAESRSAYRLSRMTFANLSCFRFTRTERNRVIDLAIMYMSTHYASLTSLRSLDVLRTLF